MGVDMWKDLLARTIGREEVAHFKVVQLAHSGASGPRVVLVEDERTGKKYAIKYGDTRVPLWQQVVNRKEAEDLFGSTHTPRIIAASDKLIMMEAVPGFTLHEVAVNGIYPLSYMQHMYSLILERFGAVWESTASKWQTTVRLVREPVSRAQRICDMLCPRVCDTFSLCRLREHTVYVNGEDVGALGTLLDFARNSFMPPRYIVRCHGDPNPDNILLDGYNNWWLIDWEWVGWNDWRVMASHLIGWWYSNCQML